MKLTKIGEVQQKNVKGEQKAMRNIMAEGWTEEKSAWDRTCAAFDQFKVGDDVEIVLSANGKYINGVNKPGEAKAGGFGGKGFSKGGYTPDPEKNTAVYTSYALDLIKATPKLTPKEAVDVVFATRELVKGKL